MVIERSVRARIIIASSSLSDKSENSNELQSDIVEEVALSLCNLVQLVYYFPASVDPWFKDLMLNVTSVISFNPTRPSDRPRRSHSFHWI